MNGIHDLGGMHGFGAVVRDVDDAVFHEAWEARVFGMVMLTTGAGVYVPDAFRFAIESLEPTRYLSIGYYGRWLAALEDRLVAAGATTREEIDARARALERGAPVQPAAAYAPPAAGTVRLDARRDPAEPATFHVGQTVRARNLNPRGHTRLPRYVRGKRGVVVSSSGCWVYPDTNAAGRGERPCHVYCVRFDGRELWGPDAEEATSVSIDLFEPYLEAA